MLVGGLQHHLNGGERGGQVGGGRGGGRVSERERESRIDTYIYTARKQLESQLDDFKLLTPPDYRRDAKPSVHPFHFVSSSPHLSCPCLWSLSGLMISHIIVGYDAGVGAPMVLFRNKYGLRPS